MTSKRHSLKKSRKGGMLNRIVATFNGEKVKTFCCSNKESKEGAWGTTNTNVGNNCEPSQTGQCGLTQYKFRCFNTKDEGGRYEIDESTGKTQKLADSNEVDEECKYVAGTLGKLGSTVANVGSVVAASFGGKKVKKSKRRSSKKKRRTNKRK
jgi:hypothetical protein